MKKFTRIPRPEEIEHNWRLVDAEGQVLGRMATRIADALRGKDKACFTPHLDTGDFVIVVNAEKVKLTGKKLKNKMYYRHSGYIGGLKTISAEDLLQKRPEQVIKAAVKGMLPKNSLARKMLSKLKIYAGPEHPHAAQMPVTMEL